MGKYKKQIVALIRSVNIRSIITEIAKKHDLTPKEVEQAANSQFSFVKKIMGKGLYEGVRLPFFGRFWVKPGRVKEIERRKAKNQMKES